MGLSASRRDPPSGRIGPGAQTGLVRVVPRGDAPAPASLEETLDELLETALFGEPLSPSLCKKAERVVRAELLRRGLKDARVAAAIDAGAVVVEIALPAQAPRVRRVVVSSGR